MTMKKTLISLLFAITLGLCSLSLVGCGGYDVTLPMGDGKIENDSVIAEFHIDEEMTDGYFLNVTFKAESSANLDRKFVFSICDADPRFSKDYKESVLFSLDGSNLANGDLKAKIEMKPSEIFEETETKKTFHIVFREESSSLDVTNCNVSDFDYTYKNGKLCLAKD